MAAPWIDALGFLNIIDWAEGLLRGIVYGDVAPARIALPHPDSDWWDETHTDRVFLNEVRDVLKDYHVKTFWHGFNEQSIWTHVPQRQARWCEYLLHRAGMIPPVTMQTVDGRNVSWAGNSKHAGKMPTRWADRPDSGRRRSASKGRRRSTAKRAETWF